MAIPEEILDERLNGVEQHEDFPGDAGLMQGLKIRLMERMRVAGLTAVEPDRLIALRTAPTVTQ